MCALVPSVSPLPGSFPPVRLSAGDRVKGALLTNTAPCYSLAPPSWIARTGSTPATPQGGGEDSTELTAHERDWEVFFLFQNEKGVEGSKTSHFCVQVFWPGSPSLCLI